MAEATRDRSQLMRLFQKQLANGIRFCGTQPPRIEIKSRRQHDRWVVEVSDNGVGIEPKHFQKILHIFSRLHTR